LTSADTAKLGRSKQARVVLERSPRTDPDAEAVRQLRTLTWGLVPSWAKEVKLGRLINARSETVTEKPAFTPEPQLQPYPVSTKVNNPRNNGPELVEPA
jgi:putative SOS response-associated peptidase YedK